MQRINDNLLACISSFLHSLDFHHFSRGSKRLHHISQKEASWPYALTVTVSHPPQPIPIRQDIRSLVFKGTPVLYFNAYIWVLPLDFNQLVDKWMYLHTKKLQHLQILQLKPHGENVASDHLWLENLPSLIRLQSHAFWFLKEGEKKKKSNLQHLELQYLACTRRYPVASAILQRFPKLKTIDISECVGRSDKMAAFVLEMTKCGIQVRIKCRKVLH
jgi:hypothetical protein